MRLLFSACLAAATAPAVDVATFEEFKTAYAKIYRSAAAERHARLAFAENDKRIKEHNARFQAGRTTYWLAHNGFSDLTLAEFKAAYLASRPPSRPRHYDQTLLRTPAPPTNTSIDWVAKGAVTSVKNQGGCGSCWAFAATGAIEGRYQISGQPLTAFSEQQLVSCENKHVWNGTSDEGCAGGDAENAFWWLTLNHTTLCTEAAWPYTSGTTKKDGPCNQTCAKGVTNVGKGYADVPNEAGLLPALVQGPVAAGIEGYGIMSYKGGVFANTSCSKDIDHGILIVGFGTDPDSQLPYYKVKNR